MDKFLNERMEKKIYFNAKLEDRSHYRLKYFCSKSNGERTKN